MIGTGVGIELRRLDGRDDEDILEDDREILIKSCCCDGLPVEEEGNGDFSLSSAITFAASARIVGTGNPTEAKAVAASDIASALAFRTRSISACKARMDRRDMEDEVDETEELIEDERDRFDCIDNGAEWAITRVVGSDGG